MIFVVFFTLITTRLVSSKIKLDFRKLGFCGFKQKTIELKKPLYIIISGWISN